VPRRPRHRDSNSPAPTVVAGPGQGRPCRHCSDTEPRDANGGVPLQPSPGDCRGRRGAIRETELRRQYKHENRSETWNCIA
jgi:hypothetical protein